ncbi:MAG: hypothetical protein Q8761_03155, partial [Sweet potato little leaf phytoplasma]|nr:hypothetical protein [Sweet potato little leaf phytoplasma]
KLRRMVERGREMDYNVVVNCVLRDDSKPTPKASIYRDSWPSIHGRMVLNWVFKHGKNPSQIWKISILEIA